MTNSKLPRGYKVYIPLVMLFILFSLLLPRSPKFNYEYKKGEHWTHETLISEFDFPLLKSDAELGAEKDAAKKNRIPFFRKKASAYEEAVQQLKDIEFGTTAQLRPILRNCIRNIYKKGVFNDKDLKYASSAANVYIQNSDAAREEKYLSSEIYTQVAAEEYMMSAISVIYPDRASTIYDSLDLASLIIPDLEYDNAVTEQIYADNIYDISLTRGVVKMDTVLVENGQIITDDVANLLDSYKAEFDKSVAYGGSPFAQWLGISLVALLMVTLFFFAIFFCNYSIFTQYNKYLYTLLLYALISVLTFVLARYDSWVYYLVPYTLIAMYMVAFFSKRFVMIVYFLSLLPILIVSPGSVDAFFIHLLGGFVSIHVFERFNKGWLQFVGAFILFVLMSLVWLGFALMQDSMNEWIVLLYIAVSAGLSVAGYPLIYLFERIFMLVSSTKLVELSDTSNKLLRMLADKAPGTFHHSLQVMNLADAAARAIDANIPLVRAAALYHDIGKINNPQCFIENEAPGVKVHEGLSPRESAVLITRHVPDGLALAEKHNLPKVLREFIASHHGTTSASYFLTKYLNDGGDPDDVADFYYDGVKPVTKEQVIIMLCDAVEAASRSLKDYSTESISALVDRIVDGKAADGQLTDSDVSLREINVIKDVMKSFLQQVYHSRIAYPKRKDEAGK